MHIDSIRELCLSFPGVVEQIQWGDDLLFKVGGKMFAAMPLVPAPVFLSFKASPENFAELTERPNIIPAPYLARAQWVALESKDAVNPDELARLLRESYELVRAKLPKKVLLRLSSASAGNARTKRGESVPTKRKTRKKERRES